MTTAPVRNPGACGVKAAPTDQSRPANELVLTAVSQVLLRKLKSPAEEPAFTTLIAEIVTPVALG